MMKNRFLSLLLAPVLAVSLSGCAHAEAPAQTSSPTMVTVSENPSEQNPVPGPATLLYQGQASIRVVTAEGNVIYIDPYAGDGYDLAADLILVTHSHFDHNQISKIANRKPDCRIITWAEAIQEGEHQVFDLGYVTVEAVEAGFNSMHDVSECVGYVLTFSNGASVYVTGDTSTTEQMPALAEKEIDYAFFCCDGVYNMGLDEAAQCAEMVKAKHNIPYHVTASTRVFFDRERAEQFDVENRIILGEGEELALTTAESENVCFSDVDAGDWYADAAVWCVNHDIMGNGGETVFSPNAAMTRSAVVDALYRAAGRPASRGENQFSDIDAAYSSAADWASERGIMSGYGGGIFGASDPVTREQLVTALWRYAGSPTAETGEPFSDEEVVTPYAREAVRWAKDGAVISGVGNNRFDPKATLTRAQAAVIFQRYFMNDLMIQAGGSVDMEQDRQAVEAAYRSRCDAMVSKDIDALSQMMADDLILQHITGATQTKQEWLDCITNETMRYYSIDIQKLEVEVQGNTAVAHHTAALDARIYGSRGTWTLSGESYFVKQDGKWLWSNALKT